MRKKTPAALLIAQETAGAFTGFENNRQPYKK
jgi:hypothetical protein